MGDEKPAFALICCSVRFVVAQHDVGGFQALVQDVIRKRDAGLLMKEVGYIIRIHMDYVGDQLAVQIRR